MNNGTMISIIVPFFNAEKYINRCVESLQEQTYKNFEVIFIDDGSTDGSTKILNQYKDKRFKILHQKKRGVSAARNLGLSKVTGKYIGFMDVDDELFPTYLEQLLFSAENNSVDIVLCDYCNIYPNGRIEPVYFPWHNKIFSDTEIRKELIPKMIIEYKTKNTIIGSVWRAFIRKSFWENNKILFDENLVIAEDLIFLISLLCKVSELYILSECLYKYNQHLSSTLHIYSPSRLKDHFLFYDSLLLVLKSQGLYNENIERCNCRKLLVYTQMISNLSRNPDFKDSLKKMDVLYSKLKKEEFDWRKYQFSKLRKISLWMLEHRWYIILLLLYKIKEKIRLRYFS